MRLPEGKEGHFAGAVRTSDAVQINLDFTFRTTLGDGFRQTICPFPDKLSSQDNFDSISQIKDSGAQHNQNVCMFRSEPFGTVTCCNLDS
jgi:hypothetical protein